MVAVSKRPRAIRPSGRGTGGEIRMASLAACAGYTFFTRYIFQPGLDLLGRAEQPRTGGENRGDSRPPIRPDRAFIPLRQVRANRDEYGLIPVISKNLSTGCSASPLDSS